MCAFRLVGEVPSDIAEGETRPSLTSTRGPLWSPHLGTHTPSGGSVIDFQMIIFNDSRGSTLFVSLYISFAQAAHDA
jgi:hypothetical protein